MARKLVFTILSHLLWMLSFPLVYTFRNPSPPMMTGLVPRILYVPETRPLIVGKVKFTSRIQPQPWRNARRLEIQLRN